MCYYTYTIYTCCSEPKEYDGVRVFDVIYCNDCPLSADSRLYDDDFFHCPNAIADCLGDSMYYCPECSRTGVMEDNGDEMDRNKDPYDDFSEDSDSEYEEFLDDWEEVYA
ncbi:MAG: hypothetical protein ASARMPREDX12_006495 [Alectoria sarmentosa]|nr:MAG: hypothetical protein ASARMPREDX12_006495 [Alectoria sarmentosa]